MRKYTRGERLAACPKHENYGKAVPKGMMKWSNISKENIGYTLALLMVAIMLCCILGNTPCNIIRKTLQERYQISTRDMKVENIGNGIYRLLNAPVEQYTGVKLEYWKINIYGLTGIFSFATPLDVSEKETINLDILFFEDELRQLNKLSESQGQSANQIVHDMVKKELLKEEE